MSDKLYRINLVEPRIQNISSGSEGLFSSCAYMVTRVDQEIT